MFGGGGGGLNPQKMQQMMEQMGIDVEELDATEVIIRTADGEELYFDGPDVTRMDARGQQTYQIVGEPTTRESTAGGETPAVEDESESDSGDGSGTDVEDQDVQIVVQRTGASEAAAREALEATDGDLAAAVERLE